MGSTIARDLVKSREVEEVTVCDVEQSHLRTLRQMEHSSKLKLKKHDVRGHTRTVELLRQFDVGVGALPHELCNYPIMATIAASTWLDVRAEANRPKASNMRASNCCPR